MVAFLAEVYTSAAAATLAPAGIEHLSRAADELTREGTAVRFVRSILIPEDETCFYLYEAGSRQAVYDAAARAGLRLARVTEALCEPCDDAGDIPADAPLDQRSRSGTAVPATTTRNGETSNEHPAE
jgi:hypothetical protein